MAWVMLFAASVLEIVWAIALKHADGFTRLVPSLVCVTAAASSFLLLSLAFRQLPVGTAYVVWVGTGALGVALVGIVALGESAAPVRLACLLLILLGIVGLKLVDARA